ncbi:Electron transport complex protein rnfD (Nitrogen fixation protein rnfD) (fragment) [Candidatus Accumulibacter aalborgensis]|uniref:Electron transport complex protein rnfD (Nitrogen fixation protein rnfD) n=1 Tax=Candidatus Accumulibacter aalborgensis TaxID=1860102 RepID=A0A1A8XMW3_9PROT
MKAAGPATDAFASPHAHGGNSIGRTMLRVQIALLPATAFGFWLFGWPAFFLWLLTILSCLGFEALALTLMGSRRIKATLLDGSALLTGWLLALTLPPWAPWWVAVVGGFMAIVIGKQVFGGVGQNVFNPAMVARVALLGAFFIATDYVTSPNTGAGQIIFGLGVGLLTWIIRSYGGYPEGMAFAVLLMNALTPVIGRQGKPLAIPETREA